MVVSAARHGSVTDAAVAHSAAADATVPSARARARAKMNDDTATKSATPNDARNDDDSAPNVRAA